MIKCVFCKEGEEASDVIETTEDKCTLSNEGSDNPNHYFCIDIDVSSLPTVTGTIEITAHYVKAMLGGISLGNSGLVGVCTKVNWQKLPDEDQNKVIIHEIGHQLGMVSNGSGILPDQSDSHYVEHGHRGNHCSAGLSASDKAKPSYSGLKESSKCVMFGEVHHYSFCSECAVVVKKVDLSSPVK